jgi:hypothetical protein
MAAIVNTTTCPETPRTPDPEWLRGACPRCGEELVSNCYYVAGRGFLVLWECVASLQPEPTCDYRRLL